MGHLETLPTSAETYAVPVHGHLGGPFPRRNEFNEEFHLRWGRIDFFVAVGVQANVKVILRAYREHICETYIVDTDPYDVQWDHHERRTRDFYLLARSAEFGPLRCVKFSFVVHLGEHSIPSELEYIFMDQPRLEDEKPHDRHITRDWATASSYRTYEVNAGELQSDVDWYRHHFDSLRLIPKFTKGQPDHPYHPKRFIHDRIQGVIDAKQRDPERFCTIKVSVDCIDDSDFTRHLVYASERGVWVQCIVDWRKTTLTNSANYARVKRSGIELLGVFCTPRHPLIEVDPDMHTKFIIFNDEDCIIGSFNITFDRWGANWESGMTFHSKGVCRLLDNIFQSQRGGVVQQYCIDALSQFNLLYTSGRHTTMLSPCSPSRSPITNSDSLIECGGPRRSVEVKGASPHARAHPHQPRAVDCDGTRGTRTRSCESSSVRRRLSSPWTERGRQTQGRAGRFIRPILYT